MDMKTFVKGCYECDPKAEPERAAELLKSAAELGEAILKQREKRDENIPYENIFNAYNELCGGVLPKAAKLTDKRKRAIKNCFSKGFSEENLCDIFRQTISTPFLIGKNERGWRANFDFILNPDNLQKILEGVYGAAVAGNSGYSDFDPDDPYKDWN